MEIDLTSGEERLTLKDAEPFPVEQPKIARVAAGNRDAEQVTEDADIRRDSVVSLRLPSVDLDSDQTFDVSLWFFSGQRPLVLIAGDAVLPTTTLGFVLAVVASTLKETNWEQGRYLQLAREVKNLGLWILHRRIRKIEQSVRDALEDEHINAEDFAALRDYPARLALVENAARRLNEFDVEWNSAQQENRSPFALLGPIAPDPLPKFISEAADDAREAVTRLSGLISSQQIVLTQRQALENQRFQRVVTIVGAAVLVPGLVAAIFGANVGFHGRNTSGAFWAMLLLMAGSGIISYALIRSVEMVSWEKVRERRAMRWFLHLSNGTRLGACASLGLLVLGIGMVLLVTS